MSRVGDCPRCGAPQGLIGWLCDHTGNEEHDQDMDWESERFAQRMGLKNSKHE